MSAKRQKELRKGVIPSGLTLQEKMKGCGLLHRVGWLGEGVSIVGVVPAIIISSACGMQFSPQSIHGMDKTRAPK